MLRATPGEHRAVNTLLMPSIVLPGVWALAMLGTLGTVATAWRVATAAATGVVIGAVAELAIAPVAGVPHVVALLVAMLGFVTVRYSARYLVGEPGQTRYLRALLFTLASVTLVVTTDHLGVLVAAWIASSLGLHELLTFYPDRRPAQLAARKKFLIGRLADAVLVVAAALVWWEIRTLSIPALATWLVGVETLPLTLEVAALGFALGALLKSAQLPLHGWLIQVMEAPTPVSALLHAGVVNLGGFVLIRLAALLSLAPAAQALLVVVGGVTVLGAGLVMATRISIKVRLAWSTCAQMGFLLLECGLGLYGFAALHLVAHSLYKAHAFLSAGATVARATVAVPQARPSVVTVLAAPVLSAVVVAGLWYGTAQTGVTEPPHWVAGGILVLGTAPLWWRGMSRGLVCVVGVALLALLQHLLFGLLAPDKAASVKLCVLALGFMGLLYLLQGWLAAAPRSAAANRLHQLAFAGFHLDEPLSRWVLKVWPLRTGSA